MADNIGRTSSRYEFSADPKQFALLLGVAGLFVVVVFFSGVLVGNIVAKRQARPTLASATVPGEAGDKKSGAIDEERILKELDASAAPEPGMATPPVESAPLPMAEPEPPTREAAPPQIKREVVELTPPPPVRKPKPTFVPSVKPKPAPSLATRHSPLATGSSYYSVQVAAFRERPLADRFANNLKSKAYEAYVVKANLPSGLWYRVRVGKVTSEAQAQSLHSKLVNREKLAGIIVHEGR
ncbi:MAG: SPOR domain-containing protein [Nitrospirae bacterium]|nr:SPOR domain-containing protein [Nitrospirota bacterium]